MMIELQLQRDVIHSLKCLWPLELVRGEWITRCSEVVIHSVKLVFMNYKTNERRVDDDRIAFASIETYSNFSSLCL